MGRINDMLDRLKGRDIWWGPLTVLLLCALILFGVYCLRTGKSIEGIGVITGVLISKINTLVDFRYGSSKGSKDKTDLISNNKNTSTP
jgi:hypothetical protein